MVLQGGNCIAGVNGIAAMNGCKGGCRGKWYFIGLRVLQVENSIAGGEWYFGVNGIAGGSRVLQGVKGIAGFKGIAV